MSRPRAAPNVKRKIRTQTQTDNGINDTRKTKFDNQEMRNSSATNAITDRENRMLITNCAIRCELITWLKQLIKQWKREDTKQAHIGEHDGPRRLRVDVAAIVRRDGACYEFARRIHHTLAYTFPFLIQKLQRISQNYIRLSCSP